MPILYHLALPTLFAFSNASIHFWAYAPNDERSDLRSIRSFKSFTERVSSTLRSSSLAMKSTTSVFFFCSWLLRRVTDSVPLYVGLIHLPGSFQSDSLT